MTAPGGRTALLALLALLLLPVVGQAQDTLRVEPAPAPEPPTSPYRARVVASHAHGTAVAVSLRLPHGARDDQEGLEGTAWLLGRVLEDQGNRALDPARARLEATVDRMTTTFTLLALPAEWEEAWARVDSVLFDAPLDEALVEEHRSGLLQRMAFEAGSPFRDFEARAVELLAGPGSPAGRALRGTRSSLPNVSAFSLGLYRASFYRRDAAVQAVAGPVPPEPREATEAAPPATPDPGPDPEAAALPTTPREATRTLLVQDVTSTWMAVVYPAPSTLPRTRLELVAHLVRETLDPVPALPDRYGVDVRIEETPEGAALMVEASVYPEAATRWEARILGAVEELAGAPLGEDFFAWRRRRFRAARLLDEAAPEVEARRLTADLLREGRARDLSGEIWALDAASLQRAAASMGPPRILVLGPDLGAAGDGGR